MLNKLGTLHSVSAAAIVVVVVIAFGSVLQNWFSRSGKLKCHHSNGQNVSTNQPDNRLTNQPTAGQTDRQTDRGAIHIYTNHINIALQSAS